MRLLFLVLALAGCRVEASDRTPEPKPKREPEPATRAPTLTDADEQSLVIPAKWWRSVPEVADAPRWGQLPAGPLVLPTGERLELPATKVGILATSDTHAVANLYVEPLALVAHVPIEALERAFVVRPTPLQPDHGEPWIELAPGSRVIPITKRALEGDEAPVIVEASTSCETFTWRGTVASAAIGRVVERTNAEQSHPGEPVRVRGRTRLEDDTGNERLVLPVAVPSIGDIPGGFSAYAVVTGDDDRIKVRVPFPHYTVVGWVAPGDVVQDTRRSSNDIECATRTSDDHRTGEPREATVMLPEQTCLYSEEGMVAAVLRPPHVIQVGTMTEPSRDIAPAPLEVGAQRLEAGRWRVWIPTRHGEVSFVAAEQEPGSFERCPRD